MKHMEKKMKHNGRKFLLVVAALVLLVNLTASRPAGAQTSELFVSSLFGPDGRNDTSQILRYDGTSGAFIDAFVPSGSGELRGPAGMTFGADGNLYVCSTFTDNGNGFEGRVLRYDGTTGAFIDTFITGGTGGLNRPQNLAFGPDGNLYVCSADNGHDYILRYDGTTGAFMDTFVPAGSGGLGSPLDLIFGPDGNLYVSQQNVRANTHSVLRYDGTTGAFIDAFVSNGSGGLFGPQGLVFGPDGNLYVSSRGTNEVLRYDGTTGAFIDAFVARGSGGLMYPGYGLAFGPDGNLYVTELDTKGRVVRYDGTTGAFMDAFVPAGSGGLNAPSALIFR